MTLDWPCQAVENRGEAAALRAEEDAVDFIERWLHVSPDGGSGTLELVIYLAPILLAGILVLRWRWPR